MDSLTKFKGCQFLWSRLKQRIRLSHLNHLLYFVRLPVVSDTLVLITLLIINSSCSLDALVSSNHVTFYQAPIEHLDGFVISTTMPVCRGFRELAPIKELDQFLRSVH